MISTEIERAHMAVLRHNLSGRDKGREAFDDMMARAPMPASIATRIDRGTAERIILYRFADRMPFAIRLTDAQIQSVKSDLLQEIKRLSN